MRLLQREFPDDHLPLLRWLMFTGVCIFGFVLAWHYGLFHLMLTSDRTYISAIICVLAQVSGHLWAQATEVTEAHAKASWLLCFAQYVNWRDEDFASKDAPVILGILGESPFDKKEVEYLRSVTIQKRPIETRFLKDIEDKDAAAPKCGDHVR